VTAAPGTERADCERFDRADPLASRRAQFLVPDGVVYLDGNSLGALAVGVAERVHDVVHRQWGHDLIRSWNTNGWWNLPTVVGDKIGRLVGAAPGEVVACDSTSVNLYKLAVAAQRLRPDRHIVLTDKVNFPTDLYILDEAARSHGAAVRRVAPADVCERIDRDVAVVALTHVDYRTGEVYDLAAVTAAAHAQGALALWDLSHSAGALAVDLGGAGADLAVGCGYKYLNGGPGAPAYVYVAQRWQDALAQPLTGWLGHADPFAMSPEFRPAVGVRRALTGTPAVLSLAALDAALDTFEGLDMAAVRAKSVALTELFIELVDERLPGVFTMVSPRTAKRRGSQVSLGHPDAYAIVQALIARGVIGDYRAPDVARFGFAPLYLRHVDVWDAVDHLVAVMAGEEWRRAEHQVRATVT
jgi:kynureninase